MNNLAYVIAGDENFDVVGYDNNIFTSGDLPASFLCSLDDKDEVLESVFSEVIMNGICIMHKVEGVTVSKFTDGSITIGLVLCLVSETRVDGKLFSAFHEGVGRVLVDYESNGERDKNGLLYFYITRFKFLE